MKKGVEDLNKKTFYLTLRIVGIIAVLLFAYYSVLEEDVVQFIKYLITLTVVLFLIVYSNKRSKRKDENL
ncbi:hypothetical protein [Sporosarcina sp. 6E9]|uniref:hypothetical protein n=1 Tax=Sporosarcina sp. 6E9 TaxID=2819235 RepID=UPI001B312D2D|nr:hypothetical protein [Sporosarcina sp. 6E9]